jgi:hypothetical protein
MCHFSNSIVEKDDSMFDAPTRIVDLVKTFDRNIEAYHSHQYNEAQLRREFIEGASVVYRQKNNPPVEAVERILLNSLEKRLLLEDRKMFEQILDQFEQLLQQEIVDFGVDFAKNEQVVWKTILSLGHAALQRIVNRQRNDYQGSWIPCNCGGWMRFVQHRSRDTHTLLGWMPKVRP